MTQCWQDIPLILIVVIFFSFSVSHRPGAFLPFPGPYCMYLLGGCQSTLSFDHIRNRRGNGKYAVPPGKYPEMFIYYDGIRRPAKD
jgi:hypothetical protein